MTLADLLQRQRDRLDALLDLLRHEQALLVQGGKDMHTLAALAADKEARLGELEALERRRLEMQRALGHGEHSAGAERAAAQSGNLGLWQGIRDKTRRAAYLNRLNGSLVQHRLIHTQRVLGSLRERAATTLYGADGQAQRSAGRLQSRA